MTRVQKWKPGDVALVEAGCWANPKVALRLAEGWSHVNGVDVDGDGIVNPVRPLVVIDPEDREQVAHLIRLWGDQYTSWSPDADGANADNMQAALREFANPTPPIEEPTEAASLVEDEDGAIWGRQCTQGGGKDMSRPWMQLVNGRAPGPLDRERDWRGITVVRVLSEGVPSEAVR